MDKFPTKRSPVICRNGCVSCSQPLAAEAGLQILKGGGNAADAAVAVAAAMNVTQPCSTGIGGDSFCLFYQADSRKVSGINGSGRAPKALTLEYLNSLGHDASNPIPSRHALSVTVPGAAAAWADTISTFGSGKYSLQDVLQPAIELAEQGVPVAPVAAHLWGRGSWVLTKPGNIHGKDMLLNGAAPKAGDIMRMPLLANTFKTLGKEGKAGFYRGPIAKAIADCVRANGGVLSEEDLAAHVSTFDEPIKTTYRGVDVWEIPPSGQGITALMALNILETFDFSAMKHNSAEYLHLLIEALQLSFADTWWYNADPSKVIVPIEEMLSKSYAASRAALISSDHTLPEYLRGEPCNSSDTVYFTVVDCHGNACSFINSNFMGFGTGLVPEGCGFTLQNRGNNFVLDPAHPNVVAPGKRPYHTIIPGMATHAQSGDLMCSFGVMGGFMQPQGHVQVLMNMLEFGMNPQEAIDSPRFCIIPSKFDAPGVEQDKSGVCLEDGIDKDVIAKLETLGHSVIGPVMNFDRYIFGRGHIIKQEKAAGGERVLWAGCDGRSDGTAVGY